MEANPVLIVMHTPQREYSVAKSNSWTAWTVQHEFQFIDGLGSYSNRPNMSRLDLLLQYGEALELRKDWGDINALAVRRKVLIAIEDEQAA